MPPEDVTALRAAHARFRAWLFGAALPFWGGVGHAGPGRGTHEHLQLDGTPATLDYTRMRVQARQIYVFSHAALLGWTEGERLARDGYAFITRRGGHPEGGWVRRLAPSGDAVVDGAIDLYDQAFVLFALAWYARLTGDAEPLRLARETTAWIRDRMAAPHGGYHNVVPAEPGPRQQNPHMHLLEAMLALHETTGEGGYLRFADELVSLFRTRLFDPATATLGEFFAADWSHLPGPEGSHVEPGHHYEWVWLLDQYARRTGRAALPEGAALYDFARHHGTDPGTGLVWDVVGRDGQVRRRSTRLWPQTEALKAHAAMAGPTYKQGRDTLPLLAQGIGLLMDRFLAGGPDGAWTDQFDAAGAPAANKIPTSSFYHVMMAFAELDGFVARLPG